jgi:hypothetical protein
MFKRKIGRLTKIRCSYHFPHRWIRYSKVAVDLRLEQHILYGISNISFLYLKNDADKFLQFSTLICVFTLDRIGRRWTLYWGSVGQGVAMFLAGGMSRLAIDSTNPGKASQYGAAAASMIFIFTFVFGATWLTVPWLCPAEIFPLEVRAKGNALGVVGWSIGNGWLVRTPLPPNHYTHTNAN